ncbi:MAG TPA: HDOD domain-containing protein, partial [Gemmatimonadales bacterium]|nr:HDOD domain-containing protein [Gemmatimonadales bacterium]
MALKPAELVEGIVRVGTVHTIYDRLSEVMSHPLSSAGDIGKVIAEDPDLTARLLRLVNSPIYGFPSRISTVSQAISIVGMNQLHELAIGAGFIRLFQDLPEGLVDMNGFWRHSVTCAVAARTIAVQRREPNAERFFVAGLLHDIGRPVIYQKLPAQSKEILLRCRSTGELMHRVEVDVFGFHHGQVGAALLERWKLPALLQEAVAWHHNPRLATRYPIEAAAVHVADHIANAFQLGTSG